MLFSMVTAQNIILLLKISLVTTQVLQLIIGFFYRSCNYSYRSYNNFPFYGTTNISVNYQSSIQFSLVYFLGDGRGVKSFLNTSLPLFKINNFHFMALKFRDKRSLRGPRGQQAAINIGTKMRKICLESPAVCDQTTLVFKLILL